MGDHEVSTIERTLALFDRPVAVLEWGSGHSTAYFPAALPAGSLWVSIEHDAAWARQVGAEIARLGLSAVKLLHVPNNRPFEDGVEDGSFRQFRDYVLAPRSLGRTFDFILVDGRARVECLRHGWELLAPDGVMVLHDANRAEYHVGVSEDAVCLRVVHPERDLGEGPTTMLLLGRSEERLRQLRAALEACLAPPVAVERVETGDLAGAARRLEETQCVFLNTYYRAFLERVYREHPEMMRAPYAEQHAFVQRFAFGDSDFYSAGLQRAGWRATDLVLNCEPLQQAWAAERGRRHDLLATALAQIGELRPEVVYIQDMNLMPRDFLHRLRPLTRLVVGQIATTVVKQIPFDLYDIVVSSFPHYVEKLRAAGVCAYYQPLAFDPRLIERLELRGHADRPEACSFVGGLDRLHPEVYRTFDLLAQRTPIRFWGYGASGLPADALLRRRHQGEVWGLEMFQRLADSRITVNRHREEALQNANNMRLFEATGCGALLVTDYKDNLDDLFEIGREVVAYRSPEEAAHLVNYYLAHPDEAAEIAAAGQRRTLRDHTYERRMEHTAEFLERHLRYTRDRYRFGGVDYRRISYGKELLDVETVPERLTTAWKDASIPRRQRALVQEELAQLYEGRPPRVYRAMAEALKYRVQDRSSVLEVGCASGYYAEVLDYLLGLRLRYVGVDYSEPMIEMARSFYPGVRFEVADGADLPFDDAAFDVAITSGVLLHVTDYVDHIREAARVARTWVVAHKTPVSRRGETVQLKKFAYDVETLEYRFGEAELLEHFEAAGLRHVATVPIHENPAGDDYEMTYVLAKSAR